MTAAAPSGREVDAWLERVDDIADAIDEILHSDPLTDLARHEAREKRRLEEEAAAKALRLEQVKMRYEPKNYARFERDDVIESMLKKVDEKPEKKVVRDASLYSKAELLSLEEAKRLKDEGSKHVQRGNWGDAFRSYDSAIKLAPVDPDLLLVLHNNRALTANKIGKYMQALEDASVVLEQEERNVKALLRRATALRYLHRPVEALDDIKKALKCEPKNAEALLLRTWLFNAEKELLMSDQFMSSHETDAQKLCTSAEALTSAIKSEEASKDRNEQWACCYRALNDAGFVLREYGTGACVLFSLRGGVEPALLCANALLGSVSLVDLSSQVKADKSAKELAASQEMLTLLSALRVLSSVFEECETVVQDVREGDMKALIHAIRDVVVHPFVLQPLDSIADGCAPLLQTLVCASLECIVSLYTAYASLINQALDVEWKPLNSLWSVVVHADSLKSFSSLGKVMLFHFARLMTACLKSQGTVIAIPPNLPAFSVVRQLFKSSCSGEAREESELVLAVVEMCLSTSMPLPIQTLAAGLALRRTCVTVMIGSPGATSSSTSSSTSLKHLESEARPPQFSSESWSRKLCEAILQHLEVCTKATPQIDCAHELRFLEAGYSLLYNISLSTENRTHFCTQWLAFSSPNIAERTWMFLEKQGDLTLTAEAGLSAQAKMLGVLSKFISYSPSLRLSLRSAAMVTVPQAPPPLWRMLERVVMTSSPLTTQGEPTMEVRWEMLEHLSAILALQHHHLPASGTEDANGGDAYAAEGAAVLLQLIAMALPPSEEAVRLWEASSNSAVGLTESSATRRISIPLISLGNAALLMGNLIDAASKCAATKQEMDLVLTKADAVKGLLHTLRETRTALLFLSRERAEAEKKRQSSTLRQLQLWEKHALAAQKNLGIALSKSVTNFDAMRVRLRELNGLETLVAIMNN